MKIYCYSHVNKEFWESTLTEFLNELNELNECLYRSPRTGSKHFEVYSTTKLGLKKLIRDEELK